jgi:hypothetical protein
MVDGKIIGAIGVSGALSSHDAQVAKPEPMRWRNSRATTPLPARRSAKPTFSVSGLSPAPFNERTRFAGALL